MRFLTAGLGLLPFLCIGEAERPPENLDVQIRLWKTFLAKKFADPEIWTDAKRRPELVQYLRQARDLPDESYAAALAEKICFPAEETQKLRLPADSYPAYGALRVVGPAAVPHVLKRLKTIDPDVLKPKGNLTQAEIDLWYLKNGAKIAENECSRELLIQCLIDVYNPGGDGVELARTRLSAEMKVSTARERRFLQAALDHPLLKPATEKK